MNKLKGTLFIFTFLEKMRYIAIWSLLSLIISICVTTYFIEVLLVAIIKDFFILIWSVLNVNDFFSNRITLKIYFFVINKHIQS